MLKAKDVKHELKKIVMSLEINMSSERIIAYYKHIMIYIEYSREIRYQ